MYFSTNERCTPEICIANDVMLSVQTLAANDQRRRLIALWFIVRIWPVFIYAFYIHPNLFWRLKTLCSSINCWFIRADLNTFFAAPENAAAKSCPGWVSTPNISIRSVNSTLSEPKKANGTVNSGTNASAKSWPAWVAVSSTRPFSA